MFKQIMTLLTFTFLFFCWLTFKKSLESPIWCDRAQMFCPTKVKEYSLAAISDQYQINVYQYLDVEAIVDQLFTLNVGPLQFLILLGWFVDFSFPAVISKWIVVWVAFVFVRISCRNTKIVLSVAALVVQIGYLIIGAVLGAMFTTLLSHFNIDLKNMISDILFAKNQDADAQKPSVEKPPVEKSAVEKSAVENPAVEMPNTTRSTYERPNPANDSFQINTESASLFVKILEQHDAQDKARARQIQEIVQTLAHGRTPMPPPHGRTRGRGRGRRRPSRAQSGVSSRVTSRNGSSERKRR